MPLDKFGDVPTFIHKAAGEFFNENEFVALKIHFGEKGNKGYINPSWVRPIVNMVKKAGAHPFLTDTNTIYRGQRADAVHHLMIAQGHGFKIEKVGAPVIIADGLRGNEYVEVPIKGKHFKSLKIAKGIHDAHAMIVLTHTKGHVLTGFGGAIKNIGMGCGAKGGKYEMHDSVCPRMIIENCVGCGECIKWCSGEALTLVDGKIALSKDKCIGCGECILACPSEAIEIPWDSSSADVQEKLAEYAWGVVKNKPTCYINYMHHITRNCDCFPADKEGALLDDIGILVSVDPVAIDQASIDLINKKAGKDLFKELHKGVDYSIHLINAEKLGLGTREYELISVR